LTAENDELRQRLKQAEEERDTYRAVVYSWARSQFGPEDFRRKLAEKERLPFEACIGELEQTVRVNSSSSSS
jgi:hypothetical protein